MPWSSRESLQQKKRHNTSKNVRDLERKGSEAASSRTAAGSNKVESESSSESPARRQQLRSAAEIGTSYEYLDHTADVQLHAWGANLEEAFVNCGLAMLNYMTPLRDVPSQADVQREFAAEGHDMQSLLFAFLDELLFVFLSELVVLKDLRIDKFDRTTWQINASGQGYIFNRQTHKSGTEVKAITYSAMQINEHTEQGDAEVFVVVDI